MARLRPAYVFGIALLLAAGCTVDTRFSQAQLDAIQMRELDVGAERAYMAVVAAMLEQGYQITESDVEGGVLVAAVTTGDNMNGYTTALVQVAVGRISGAQASVRVSTSVNGQTRVDEPFIRHVQERIDVHAHTPVTDVRWEPAS